MKWRFDNIFYAEDYQTIEQYFKVTFYKGPFIKYGWGGPEDFQGGRLFFRKLRRGGRSVFREDSRGGHLFFHKKI